MRNTYKMRLGVIARPDEPIENAIAHTIIHSGPYMEILKSVYETEDRPAEELDEYCDTILPCCIEAEDPGIRYRYPVPQMVTATIDLQKFHYAVLTLQREIEQAEEASHSMEELIDESHPAPANILQFPNHAYAEPF